MVTILRGGNKIVVLLSHHLCLARFLKETVPQVEPPAEGQSSNAQAVQAVEAWKHSDFLCHNYVLNGLIDPLYNVYCKTTTAKELWGVHWNASTRQKMLVQDLQVLLHDIHAEGMTLSETFQVAAIIEKLPPSWRTTAGSERTLITMCLPRIIWLSIDWVIFKVLTQLVGGLILGQTRHVCADKSMFHSFRAVDNGQKLYMGNSATADIKGEGDVILKMTSEKELKLTNVEPYLDGYGYCHVDQVLAEPDMWGMLRIESALSFTLYMIEKSSYPKEYKMDPGMTSFFEKYISCFQKGTGASSRLDDKGVQTPDKGGQGFVRLVKSLLWLKCKLQKWHQKFDNTSLESGFKINECDKCVYVKDTSAGYVILCLYVDDMLIVGSNDKIIRSTKDMLKYKVDMKIRLVAMYLLRRGAISWSSSKQTVIAKSTMESEFIVLDKCGEEGEWLLSNSLEGHTMVPKTDISVVGINRLTTISTGKLSQLLCWSQRINIADRLQKALSRELVNGNHLCEREVGVASKGIVGYAQFLRALAGQASAHDHGRARHEELKRLRGVVLCEMTNTQTPPTVVNTTGSAGLARFLKETAPQVELPVEGQSYNAQAVQVVEAWKHSDFLCHNYVLNGLIDPLYNVYCKTTTAKELWESLDASNKTEDAVQRSSW
ncbi:pol polyprotein [Tanacetum coccineum]